jgi:hypothetical protein
MYLRWSDPRNFWGRWVRDTASHYRGKIHYWEVWNEPDLQEIFWGATVADYYQLLKVAYQAIKSVDPSNQVSMGGLSYWSQTGFLDELLKLMMADPTAPANNYYFDILSWHTYSRPSDMYDRVTQSRQQLAATVGARPIWVNETNVPAWDESPQNNYKPYPWAANTREQAAYIIQAFAYGIAAGADKVFVYRLQDTEWPEAYGLLRNDGTLRPAYVAYQVAARYLSGATAGSLARQGDVEQVLVRRPDERVVVVWNRTPNRVTAAIGALATSAMAIDQTGAQRSIRTTAGQYQLDLTPASANNGSDPTDFHVGGPPLVIVESAVSAGPTIDEASALIGYAGTWDTVMALGPIGGTARRAASAGVGAAIEFDGPTATWITSKGPDRGIARVVVDGAPQGDVDLYSPTALWEVPLTFGDFSPGPHRLVITALGQRASAASGTYIDVDGFIAANLRPAAPPPTPLPSPTPTATPIPTATVTATAAATSTPTPGPSISPTLPIPTIRGPFD